MVSRRRAAPPSPVRSGLGPKAQPIYGPANRISVIPARPGGPGLAARPPTRPACRQATPPLSVVLTSGHVARRPGRPRRGPHGTVPSDQPCRGEIQVSAVALNPAGTAPGRAGTAAAAAGVSPASAAASVTPARTREPPARRAARIFSVMEAAFLARPRITGRD